LRNFSYGRTGGWIDPSTWSESRGGQTYVDLREPYRRGEFQFNYLTEVEIQDSVHEIDRLRGRSGNVLMIPKPGGAYRNRDAMLALIEESSPPVEQGHDATTGAGLFSK
jgi:hypothetical protein